MLRFLRDRWRHFWSARLGRTEKPYCAGCEAKSDEIAFLRQHVDDCLDRILAMTGKFEAMREAIRSENSLPEPPQSPEEAGETEEEEQVRIDEEARRELEKMAQQVGARPEDFADIPFGEG